MCKPNAYYSSLRYKPFICRAYEPSLIIPVLSVLSVPSVLFFIPCSVPSVPQGNSVPRALRAFDMFRALRALFKIPCPPCL